ncbi:DUF1453 domain-containing protein [Streptomyces sp. NPDC051987]|uniref:DUF1453 domain-containing protein n=1 Tax=Streptomyces sp. NPDC051987 TaxID=3155808 RepID=UPI003438C834
MSGLVNALLTVAVVVVIARQFRARPVNTGRRWWLVPVVLAVVALREPGILDSHHRTASALLLATEMLVGLVMGAAWAWTTRVWTEADGVAWSKSTRASGLVWITGIAVRIGLFAVAAAIGVHQDSAALMLGLAVTLLVRGGILAWRVQILPADASMVGHTRAYGDGMARVTRKEGV